MLGPLVAVVAMFVFVGLPGPVQIVFVVFWLLGGGLGPLVAFHRRGLARLERAGLRAPSTAKLPPASTLGACRTPPPSS